MKSVIFRIAMILAMAFLLSACAATAVIEVPRRYFWPPETDEPRIEWIAAYYKDTDIKEKGLMSAIVGDDSTVEFERPVSSVGDGKGHIVICDQVKGAFFFDLNKHEVSSLGGNLEAAVLGQPSGVAVDAEGMFYIADTYSRKVFVISGENKVVRVMDISEHVKNIGGIAVDRIRGKLLVPDFKNSKVLVFTLTGQLLSTIDGKGNFFAPNAVDVFSDGGIVIADSYNATLALYSDKGEYLRNIGKRGDSPGDLSLVTGVAVDSEDHIYVTDARLHNVTIFDREGNTLLVVGGKHSLRTGNLGLGGFLVPQGIGIDKNDRIYVADTFNMRIQVFQYLNKRYLADHPITKDKP